MAFVGNRTDARRALNVARVSASPSMSRRIMNHSTVPTTASRRVHFRNDKLQHSALREIVPMTFPSLWNVYNGLLPKSREANILKQKSSWNFIKFVFCCSNSFNYVFEFGSFLAAITIHLPSGGQHFRSSRIPFIASVSNVRPTIVEHQHCRSLMSNNPHTPYPESRIFIASQQCLRFIFKIL